MTEPSSAKEIVHYHEPGGETHTRVCARYLNRDSY